MRRALPRILRRYRGPSLHTAHPALGIRMRLSGTHPEFLRIRGASLKLRSLRNPQFRELRFDIAIDVVFAELVCDANRVFDRVRIRAAMANDGYSVDRSEEHTSELQSHSFI